MWVDLVTLKMSLAALFCTFWSLERRYLGQPAKREFERTNAHSSFLVTSLDRQWCLALIWQSFIFVFIDLTWEGVYVWEGFWNVHMLMSTFCCRQRGRTPSSHYPPPPFLFFWFFNCVCVCVCVRVCVCVCVSAPASGFSEWFALGAVCWVIWHATTHVADSDSASSCRCLHGASGHWPCVWHWATLHSHHAALQACR